MTFLGGVGCPVVKRRREVLEAGEVGVAEEG
jgi:hypothetical protein